MSEISIIIDNQELTEALKQAILDGLREFEQKQDLPELLTTEGLCKMLDISGRTAQAYRDKGIIPYLKLGRKIYYRPADVLAALESAGETHRNLTLGSRKK